MTNGNLRREFWTFEYNLVSLLLILSELIKYSFDNGDLDAIKDGLITSSKEKNIWFDYSLIGKETIFLKMANDDESTDIIFINLTTINEVLEKIDLVIYITQEFKLCPKHFKQTL